MGFVAGAGFWFVAMICFHVQSWAPQPTPSGAVAGWLLVLVGTILFFLSTLETPSNLVPGWLAYFGRISYGLYLFHSLVFFLIFEKCGALLLSLDPVSKQHPFLWNEGGTLLVLVCSLFIAHLSFRYFERPFLALKKRFTLVWSREELDPAQ